MRIVTVYGTVFTFDPTTDKWSKYIAMLMSAVQIIDLSRIAMSILFTY